MLIIDIEDKVIMDPVMRCTTLPSHSGGSLLQPPSTKIKCAQIDFLENLPEHLSDTKVFTMKMEILVEPTSNKLLVDTMVDVNVNAPADQAPTMAPPTRTDYQILPHIRWVHIGKSNCYLDVEKSQSNPIYNIDTIRYDKSAGCYKGQLDEQWFYLTKDTLRDALQITPVNNNQAFTSPPSSDALINFVNELGYPKLVRNLSNVILWGVVNRAHLDYAERIWEEFTQSIHTFIEDKKNLVQHTQGKKKATLIVILSIRFTKLIIYHLQRKHKFHPRPDSSHHLPNEKPVLGYLKFSTKGTKREVFRMPIPGNLITTYIQGKSYYQEYLAKVANHQRYHVGETRSDPNSHAPKPTKTSKKSKPTGKKRKLVTEISDKPSQARKTRPCLVSKRRKPISSLRSIDESVAEDIPKKEPRVDDEEVDVQRAFEERLKCIYDVPRGPLLPVVIREPESEKYQPLPEVPRKGKEKVTEEQVAHDLLTLQTPKKKSLDDRYIFQRRTSTPTGSFSHDESSSLYAELGLMDSEEESDEDMPGTDVGVQGEGQAGPNPNAQDEGQAGPNLDEKAEGQARPNPGDAEASLPLPSPIVHVGSDLEHMDLDVVDVSTQPHPKQMDEADNDKATTETEDESMVSVTIQQDTSLIPLMTTPIIDLTSRPESPKVHQLLKATATETTTTTTIIIIHPPPSQPQQRTTYSMLMKRIGELEHIMVNLIQDNKQLEQKLDSHGARLYTLEHLDIPHQVSKAVDEVVTDAVDWAMQAPLRNRFRDLPKADMKETSPKNPPPPPPAGPSGALGSPGASGSLQVPPSPPPPPSTNQEGQSKGSAAPSSSKTAVSAKYQAWTTTDTRLRPSISLTPAYLQMDDDMAPDAQAQSSDDEDIENAHIPKVNLQQDWWKPVKEERPATPKPSWSIPSFDVPYQMEESHKLLTDNVDDSIFRHNVSKPLPLGGPPGQIKAAYYHDVGLEQTVPDQMWIKEECKYDIAAIIEVFSMYGYDYMKKRVLCRADLSEHVIAKRDFKYLYPSDFEDPYLLNLQAVTIRDRYGVPMIMRFNEIHKFSDGTLQQIDEALDYWVKEVKINRMNPGLNIREKNENKGRLPTKMKLELEHTQQGSSYEVLVAVCSSLRSLKPKCTIESRAKRSSKIISLGHYSIMLASSHTMKSKTDIKSPTHYPCEFDKWIKDSGCSKHMMGNQKFFSTYKAYNGGNVVFGSNLHGNIIGKGQICDNKCKVIFFKHDREITNDGKVIESLNMTFNETNPPSKTSPLVDDDLDKEEAIKVTEKKNLENDIEDETLELDETVNIKESKNHPLDNVIGNLNQRTLRSQPQNQSNFFCFISVIEPKNVNESLKDES
nr:integrase, catalytic region, zinc finger, CCHC-type, peptidase aspartic, catalytic [Tanacetum cinerariifolium]